MKKTIQIEDITAEVKPHFILCSYIAKDGSYIKQKYMFHSLSEAKKSFKRYIESNNLI